MKPDLHDLPALFFVHRRDFIPDLEVLEQSRSMKQCMSQRLLELSRKVTKTETDLEELSKKTKPHAQSSRTSE